MSHAYLLRNVSLFAALAEDEIAALAREFIPQSVRHGQVLFQQGSATNSLYIVKSGSIQVISYGRRHEVTYQGVYGPEQYFGEFSLLDGLPRAGQAVALLNSELLVLTRPAFFRFLERQQTVALKLLVTISRRMRFAESALDHPQALNAEQKVARLLINIAEQYSEGEPQGGRYRLGLRLTADDLAGLSGITRDAAGAVIARLCSTNTLELERSHIVLVDVPRLQAHLAEPHKAAVG